MILGIGTDLINIPRIERAIDRYGDRFLNRIFSQEERVTFKCLQKQAATYAKRWAAKEALSKALGTGMKKGVSWKEINVINLISGQPSIILSGQTKKYMKNITPKNFIARIHVSITDDPPWAQAFVIIDLNPSE